MSRQTEEKSTRRGTRTGQPSQAWRSPFFPAPAPGTGTRTKTKGKGQDEMGLGGAGGDWGCAITGLILGRPTLYLRVLLLLPSQNCWLEMNKTRRKIEKKITMDQGGWCLFFNSFE